jgi:hypothetical protein
LKISPRVYPGVLVPTSSVSSERRYTTVRRTVRSEDRSSEDYAEKSLTELERGGAESATGTVKVVKVLHDPQSERAVKKSVSLTITLCEMPRQKLRNQEGDTFSVGIIL